MKKRLALLIVTALALTVVLSGCSTGISLSNSVGEVKYKIVDDHAEVVALPNGSNDKEITIADEYEGQPVTVICDFAGCNLESAEVIHIGKNVQQIGPWSFSNNQKLTTYDISAENENFCIVDGAICDKAVETLYYYPCSGAESYSVPNTVKTIGPRAFYKNEKIKSVELPIGLIKISEMSFFQCSALEKLQLPDTIENIGKDAFTRCTALTELTIPLSIQQIDDYAFYNCTSVTKVTVEKKESDIVLGKKWYPTNNGIEIDGLNVQYK